MLKCQNPKTPCYVYYTNVISIYAFFKAMSCSLFASIVLNLEEVYSENITLANYGVLLILHLIVFLVALH